MRLCLAGISKSFRGQRALDDVHLCLEAGEIRGLLGPNGSGKSTLVRILAGSLSPDRGAGSVEVDGEPLPLPVSSGTARAAGFRFVHQDLALVERRPVVENLALNRSFMRNRIGLIDWRKERRYAESLLSEFEASFGANDLVADLSGAQRALCAIMRAFEVVGPQMKVLVLDEPTVGLPPRHVELIVSAIKRVASLGISVLFISHSIEESLRTCHTISVLRDGRIVLSTSRSLPNHAEIVEAITGHSARPPAAKPAKPVQAGIDAALVVHRLRSQVVEGIDLVLHRSEICGIVGDVNSGAAEVLPALYGATAANADSMVLHGRRIVRITPRECRRGGMVYIPADRRREALLQGLTVRENIIGGDSSGLAPRGIIRLARERAYTEELIIRIGITPPHSERLVDHLSGGNQQKTILARTFRLNPLVMLLQEPTQGVDVGAREEIAALIRGAAGLGIALLVNSTEVAELVRLCHRVIVLRHGRQVATLTGEDITLGGLRRLIHDDRPPTDARADL